MKKDKRKRRRFLGAVEKLNGSLNHDRASIKKRLTNLIKIGKQDLADQKKVTDNNFAVVDSLHVLRKYLRTEYLAHGGWMSLLTIQLADGIK